jgi:DNA uptake protein ComE-like DNA-binding protein
MPEDAGKKRFIKDFLKNVQSGTGFIDDIRIERAVRPPGSDGEGSTARSLSGRQISNITELLEDDLKHTFDEGYFTFRFVAAVVGSGKTSLLTYLQQLTETKPTYENHSVVVKFLLSDIPRSGSHSFMDKLYCHILADTFCQLLNNANFSTSVRNVAGRILSDYLDNSEVAQLKAVTKLQPFRSKFKNYITNSVDGFEEFFFYVISEVSAVDPKFSFVYLTDELDALEEFPLEIQETRLLFKELIRRAFTDFKSKIRLLIYLVGTSNNVDSFIAGDSVIQSLVGNLVINLSKGYSNEFALIKTKIDERIKGAYKRYKHFDQAWQEIQNIRLNPANTLREFCQEYASAVLEIHEKYFKEAPEQVFEGNARELVEAQCRQQWGSYLNKAGYTLSGVSTTTVLADHAFDCYVELLHNGKTVGRAFGEAKNYELLSGHLQTFEGWLNDVKFNPSPSDGNPPDLAFTIAPSCPSLLQRKLELKNIQFIESKKVDPTPTPTPNPTPTPTPTPSPTAVNINTADKAALIAAFQGTGVKKTTIDKLITRRQSKRYINLNELASDLKFTVAVKQKLQGKVNQGNICF